MTRTTIGTAALGLAFLLGYLAFTTGAAALAPGLVNPYPGQLRGVAFSLVAAILAIGLVWLAARSFNPPSSDARD